MNGGQAHRIGTLALSTLMAVIGLALIGQAVTQAGLLSPRMLLGPEIPWRPAWIWGQINSAMG